MENNNYEQATGQVSYRAGRQLSGCGIGPCPAVYDGTEQGLVAQNDCIGGIGCPQAIEHSNGYLVVGRSVPDVKAAGLEGKVEAGESAVFVPKEIIDELVRNYKG